MSIKDTPPTLTGDDILKMSVKELDLLYSQFNTRLFYNWDTSTKDDKVAISRGDFIPALLSAYFQVKYHVVTMRDKYGFGHMFRYDWDKCIYRPDSEAYFTENIKDMWKDKFHKGLIGSTILDLQASTALDRELFKLDPHYIPVQNGILYLHQDINKKWAIALLENDPKYYVVNRLPVEYDPSAECKQWDSFMLSSYPMYSAFLQDWIGTILWRFIDAPGLAVMLHGPTRTGKSTLIETLERFVGNNNKVTIPLQGLNDKNERVRLYQKLLCAWADIGKTEMKNSGMVKGIISGDTQSARRLYENSFDFSPYAQLIFSCNQVPYVYDDSDAWYGRWKIVQVDQHQYYDGDPNIIKDLKRRPRSPQELSGI